MLINKNTNKLLPYWWYLDSTHYLACFQGLSPLDHHASCSAAVSCQRPVTGAGAVQLDGHASTSALDAPR